jgi:hypothetical protein
MSNKKDQQENKSSHPANAKEASQPAGSQNSATNHDRAADVDNDSLTTGRIPSTERSSASSTKTNVTGSDLDGQTSF